MKPLFFIFFLSVSLFSVSSQTITLEECQELAQQNYPLAGRQRLIDESAQNSVSALLRQYFPQMQINGQASYQSDITRIELGNLPPQLQSIDFPSPGLDQYKIYADISQTIYDGGTIANQKKMLNANASIEKGQVAVDMYKLRDRINKTYFGILLMDEQMKQMELLYSDLQTAYDKVEIMYKNGVSLKSNQQHLEAEMLNTNQLKQEILIQKMSLIKVLSALTGKEMNETSIFLRPQPINKFEIEIRPELNLISSQIDALQIKNQQLTSMNIPKVLFFAQGGYGKPALNMFSDKFEPYFVAGVRLNWQLSSLYTLSKERNNLKVQEKSLQQQKDIFILNQQIEDIQQNGELETLKKKLKSDDEIIKLRSEIKNATKTELENGVVTSADFIRDANAESRVRQTKALHEIQLLVVQYALKWIKP
ncbi:MAG: TolC family protein [Paludibacteraceae bacterium]